VKVDKQVCKRFLSIGLMILVILALAACGGKNSSSSGGAPASGADNGASAEKPFPISIMMPLGQAELPSDTLKKIVEEKTNTKLEFQWVPALDRDQKVQTLMATNSLPSVTVVHVSKFKFAARSGQFWEIGPYLDEFPNLKNLDPNVIDSTKVDGKVYGLYQEVPYAPFGIVYRKDWADHLGISTPTTVDEFYDMLDKFTHNDPDGNGIDDTVGLTDRNELVYGSFKSIASYFGVPNNWGLQDEKLMPQFMFPQFKETLKYQKKVYDNGLVNQDYPATSKVDQKALFTSGKAGVYFGSMQTVQEFYDIMVKNNPDIKLGVQNHFEGPDGKFGIWCVPGFGDLMMFSKAAIPTEDDLKKVLSFYDTLATSEMANLLTYGIEGTHYNLVDGKVVRVDDPGLIARDVTPYMEGLSVGGPNTIDMYEVSYPYEELAKAEELTKDNNNYLIRDPAVALDSETYIEKGLQLQSIIDDAIFQYILGATDEAGFDAAVQRWLKEGGQKIIDEYNESYQKNK